MGTVTPISRLAPMGGSKSSTRTTVDKNIFDSSTNLTKKHWVLQPKKTGDLGVSEVGAGLNFMRRILVLFSPPTRGRFFFENVIRPLRGVSRKHFWGPLNSLSLTQCFRNPLHIPASSSSGYTFWVDVLIFSGHFLVLNGF